MRTPAETARLVEGSWDALARGQMSQALLMAREAGASVAPAHRGEVDRLNWAIAREQARLEGVAVSLLLGLGRGRRVSR